MNVLRLAKTIVFNRLRLDQMPSFVTYLVTLRCNSKCGFCDVWKLGANEKDELSLQDVTAIFRQIKNPDVVRITGGEPFLRKDLAAVINTIDEVSRPGMIHITSNGFLTDRVVETMENLKHPEKVHIKISIDHIGKRHDEIRGVPGAYEKAMSSVKNLVALRSKYKFHVGINQAIVNESDIGGYEALKDLLKEDNVPVYGSIAFDSTNSLYSGKTLTDPEGSTKTYGNFSKKGLDLFISKMLRETKAKPNIAERMVDQYHVKGMYNRMVHGKSSPNPPCVALNSHLRILPNGDVPVCLYNGEIVGNLKKTSLKEIWESPKAKSKRAWVRACSGCWQSCESAVSAVYTGDIVKGLV
jgi:Fe-coproporphyrin III synthase